MTAFRDSHVDLFASHRCFAPRERDRIYVADLPGPTRDEDEECATEQDEPSKSDLLGMAAARALHLLESTAKGHGVLLRRIRPEPMSRRA